MPKHQQNISVSSAPNTVSNVDNSKWGCRDLNSDNRDPNAGMTGFEPATLDGRTAKVRRVAFLAIATPI